MLPAGGLLFDGESQHEQRARCNDKWTPYLTLIALTNRLVDHEGFKEADANERCTDGLPLGKRRPTNLGCRNLPSSESASQGATRKGRTPLGPESRAGPGMSGVPQKPGRRDAADGRSSSRRCTAGRSSDAQHGRPWFDTIDMKLPCL